MILMRFLEFVTSCAFPVYCPPTSLSPRNQDDENVLYDYCQTSSGIRLPFELERYIFELALLDQPRYQSLNLLLVARRTHIWLEPLFSILQPTQLSSRPPSPSPLEHIYIKLMSNTSCSAQLDLAILSTCTNIQHLIILPSTSFYSLHVGRRSISTDADKSSRPTAPLTPSLITTYAPMPTGAAGFHAILKQYEHLTFPHLTHLMITLDRSFGLKKIDFGLKVFQNVTHLEVWNTVVRVLTAWDGIWTDSMQSTSNLALADGAGDADLASPPLVDSTGSQADTDHVTSTPTRPSTITLCAHTSGAHPHYSPQHYLPKLTHLSLGGFGLCSIPRILDNCLRLSCVVFERKDDQAKSAEVKDPRFILMPPRFLDQDKGSKIVPAPSCTEAWFSETGIVPRIW